MDRDTTQLNCYDILGVTKNSTQDEIKASYRKLTLINHPDRNNNSLESTRKIQDINKAYELVGTPESRMKYDNSFRKLNNSISEAQFNSSEFFEFLSRNIFDKVGDIDIGGMRFNTKGFNSESIKRTLNKPPPIIITEEIAFSKSYTGCTVPISVKRIIIEQDIRREETETCYLNVPIGTDDNEILVLYEKGNISGNSVGDVKVIIKIKNDTEFKRSGLDIFFNKKISLKDALCGFSFELLYLCGRTFKIANGVGNIVTPNYSKVIKNKGFSRGDHLGNLIIEFTVVFPTTLNFSQIYELKNIL